MYVCVCDIVIFDSQYQNIHNDHKTTVQMWLLWFPLDRKHILWLLLYQKMSQLDTQCKVLKYQACGNQGNILKLIQSYTLGFNIL